MKPELELEICHSANENMGIHPKSWDGNPRSEYGKGWNDAIIQLGKKEIKIKKWIKEMNLTEEQQIKIAELLSNYWMKIYAFRDDIPINFIVNWSDDVEIKDLTLEDINLMYEYFLKDKNNQEVWVKEVWVKETEGEK